MEEKKVLEELIQLNVLPKYYSIGYEIKDYAYNIEKLAKGKYAFYYYERGKKMGYQEYESKCEALMKLIQKLKFNLDNKTDLTK